LAHVVLVNNKTFLLGEGMTGQPALTRCMYLISSTHRLLPVCWKERKWWIIVGFGALDQLHL